MKLVWVGDEYSKTVAIASYVAWGRVVAPAGARLSMADVGKGQFPRDHDQGNSDSGQCHFRPEID
jgi:hypothetical protein